MTKGNLGVPIETLTVGAYTIPTETPETDGTLTWYATTLVLVELTAGGKRGLGWTYSHPAAAQVVAETLADIVKGSDAMAVTNTWRAMVRAIRNIGPGGIATMAVSAVDIALWDLQARILDIPLVRLLGETRDAIPVYGSGGFTNYTNEHLQRQLSRWVYEEGMRRVKIKVGAEPDRDLERVKAAREAIGDGVQLFVDANGAYSRKQALYFAQAFAEYGVTWLEEPVSSEDLNGLYQIRNSAPAGLNIAAGEYGYSQAYFAHMLESEAVDILQADATRAVGISGLMHVNGLCGGHQINLSTHCAPAIHLHPACAGSQVIHLEYFFDHVRIEQMLFDGVQKPADGLLRPDMSRAGLGLEFKHRDAVRFKV